MGTSPMQKNKNAKRRVGMKVKYVKLLVLSFLLVLIFVGCEKTEPPALKQIGPTKTKAGQEFNVQSDGQSALWSKTENATKTTVIMWGETQLRSTYGDPNGVTALVPKELYSKPGQFTIYLLDTKTGAKSNGLLITVE
jgi:hypothetical protein